MDLHFTKNGREARTWFRGKDAHYQLDHIFADAETARLVESCEVDPEPAERGWSDHAPVWATFSEGVLG